MKIKLTPQEEKVIFNNIDKLVNNVGNDILLVECLYALAVQLSPKNSDQLKKYTNYLSDVRSISAQNIDPIDIGGFGTLKAENAYFYFKFNNSDFAKKAEVSRELLKAEFNFTWDKSYHQRWQRKQTNLGFNIDHFKNEMIRVLKFDWNNYKA